MTETVVQLKQPAGFEAFWIMYPRKVAKLAACKAWHRARKLATEAEIMAGVERLLEHLPEDMRFIPHPTTWLNQGRWDDEYETTANRYDHL